MSLHAALTLQSLPKLYLETVPGSTDRTQKQPQPFAIANRKEN